MIACTSAAVLSSPHELDTSITPQALSHLSRAGGAFLSVCNGWALGSWRTTCVSVSSLSHPKLAISCVAEAGFWLPPSAIRVIKHCKAKTTGDAPSPLVGMLRTLLKGSWFRVKTLIF